MLKIDTRVNITRKKGKKSEKEREEERERESQAKSWHFLNTISITLTYSCKVLENYLNV